MTNVERQILYVPDMARLIGKTEASVRSLIYKQKWDAIPVPRKFGGRVGWFLSDWKDWQKWISDDRPKTYNPAKSNRGRPRKQPKPKK